MMNIPCIIAHEGILIIIITPFVEKDFGAIVRIPRVCTNQLIFNKSSEKFLNKRK